MLVKRIDHKDSDDTIGYIECIFVSENILKTIYFNKTKIMYVSFSRGGTYSYTDVGQEKYNEFEQAESQGVFFHQNIAKSKEHKCTKEFTLYGEEINEIRKIIDENTEE